MNLFLTILSIITMTFGFWCAICTLSNMIFFRRKEKKSRKMKIVNCPKVSVIIPARNEEKNLPRLLDSLLSQDWKDYEILVIDDQSTDSTWSVISSYMEKSPLVRGFRSDKSKTLSPYGKINALLQLIPNAEGEILLCTDADTVHGPSSISDGVRLMESDGLHILSGVPYQKSDTYIGGAITAAMIFSNAALPHFILNPIQFTPFAIGIGQYVMMKRKSYEEIGGYGSMPQKICDDIGIIKHFMRKGKKYGFRNLHSSLSCTMYPDGPSAFSGIERSLTDMFPPTIPVVSSLLLAVSVLILFALFPLFSPLYLKWNHPLLIPALLGWLSFSISWYFSARDTGFRKSISLSGLVSLLAICAMYLHGMYRKISGKGFDWKGRRV